MVPERVYKDTKGSKNQIKIILTLRDPVERIVSAIDYFSIKTPRKPYRYMLRYVHCIGSQEHCCIDRIDHTYLCNDVLD